MKKERTYTKKNISNLSPGSLPKSNNSQNKVTSSFKSKDEKSVLSLLERDLKFLYWQYTNFTRKRNRYGDLPSQREKPVLKSWNLHISICAASTMNFIKG